MKHTTTTFLLSLLLATLVVAALLTFLALGASSPIPWALVVLAVAVPLLNTWREKRRFVTWSRHLSVGIAEFDEDHRKLLELINRLRTMILYESGREAEKRALDELVDYTRDHFRREEELMEKYGYPGFEEHRKQHQEMAARVEQLTREYEQRGRETLQALTDYLKSRFIEHISVTDQKYRTFMREKGVG